jgi:hypothetical protein
MIVSARSVASVGSPRAARRRSASQLLVPESFASSLDAIEAAAPSAAVAQAPASVVMSAAHPGDRAVFEQFLADLAAAPAIVGELVALYIEQHPRLAIWFAARAAAARDDALEQIEAAARWREVCGAAPLAELIRAATAIACPPADPEPAPPPVILDLDALDEDWLDGFDP